MPVLAKICGLTDDAAVEAAVQHGADMLGFVFFPASPRNLSAEQAEALLREVPSGIDRVGVFVDPETDFLDRILAKARLDLLQLHGDETPEECSRYPVMTLKAFRVQGEETLAELEAYPSAGYLLDAYVKDALGGTGATFNWDLAVRAQEFGKPIFLAGGLTPENVAEAVRKVQPFGVDVSSGVEIEPGRKDAEQMRTFVAVAKGALA